MKLYEITDNQWVIIETMYGVDLIDATREEDGYKLAQMPSTTYNKIKVRDTIAVYFENGGVDDCEDEEILVYEGTVNGEWCRIYIPTYWD